MSMWRIIRRIGVAIAVLAWLTAGAAPATDYVWTGAGDGSNWIDSANWSVGGSYPDSDTARALFPRTNTIAIAANVTVAHIGLTNNVDDDKYLTFRCASAVTVTLRNALSPGAIPTLDQWSCRLKFDGGTYVVDDTTLKTLCSKAPGSNYRNIEFEPNTTLREGTIPGVALTNTTRVYLRGKYELTGELAGSKADGVDGSGLTVIETSITSASRIWSDFNAAYGYVSIVDTNKTGTSPIVLQNGQISIGSVYGYDCAWLGSLTLRGATARVYTPMFMTTFPWSGDLINETVTNAVFECNTSGLPTVDFRGNVDLVGRTNLYIAVTNRGGGTATIGRGANFYFGTGAGKWVYATNGATALTIFHRCIATNAATGETRFGRILGNGAGRSSHFTFSGDSWSPTSQIVVAILGAASNYHGVVSLQPLPGSDDTNVLRLASGSCLDHASFAGSGLIRSTNGAVQALADISPGINSAGALEFQPDLVFNAGSSYTWSTGDVIRVTNNLSASGPWTLDFADAGVKTASDRHVVAHASAISSNVVASGSISEWQWYLEINDAAGGGQDLCLCRVPGTFIFIH